VITAHIAGVPVEEVLSSASGAGGALLVARIWIIVRFRRRREPPT
jgi:hypothetical protein